MGLIRSITHNSTHEEYYAELEEARARKLYVLSVSDVNDPIIYMVRNYDWMDKDSVLYCFRYVNLRAVPMKGSK